jgi:transcriptional regulator with XRE-family HTH domain
LSDFSVEIGWALRRARIARGLTLREVFRLSEGKFKPTSISGYERGERTISVERFFELCELYDVPPQAVLAQVVGAARGKPSAEIDPSLLEAIGQEQVAHVTGFVRQILAQRSGPPPETITLREGDLQVLAAEAGTTPEELAKALEPATRRGR